MTHTVTLPYWLLIAGFLGTVAATLIGWPYALRAINGKSAVETPKLDQLIGMIVASKTTGVTLSQIHDEFGRKAGEALLSEALAQGFIVVPPSPTVGFQTTDNIRAYTREYQPFLGLTSRG